MKKTLRYYLNYIIVIIVVILFIQLPLFTSVNNIVLDSLYSSSKVRDEIVVVSIDDKSLQEIGAWPWDRKIFAQALSNLESSSPRVIGIDVLFLEASQSDEILSTQLNEMNTEVILGSKIVDDTNLTSVFTNSVSSSGFVNFSQDSDGKIRKSAPFLEVGGDCVPSFSYVIFNSYLSSSLQKINCTERSIDLRNSTLKIDNDNLVRFNYIEAQADFKEISFIDILNNSFNQVELKNKIVLIGSTAIDLRTNLNDNFTSIHGTSIPGVKIHANVINSYLNDEFIYPLNFYLESALIISISSVLLLLLAKIKSNLVDLLALISIAVIVNLAFLIMIDYGYYINFINLNIILSSTYVFNLAYKYYLQKKETYFIRNAFSQYLNPSLLNKLTQNPRLLELGGESKYMSVLFSDVRGFTTISEKLSSAQLVSLLNKYLDHVSDIIINNSGTIDKYIGDAVMAIWNAPLDDANHEINSVNTAILMDEFARDFSRNNPQYPEIKVGIGINTGEMTVGNIGGKKRFDYTVLGDNVNLAARLEGLTKKYQIPILLTESTFKKAKTIQNLTFRKIDVVIVKGKSEPIAIYTVAVSTKKQLELTQEYTKAFKLYQQAEFSKALKIFIKLSKTDPASEVFSKRCFDLQKNTPPKWDGVWRWEEK